MFEQIERVPGDPILGLIDAFNQDVNPSKIDLGVGVYRDAQGHTPILRAVKEAEALLLARETTKSYIGSHGDPQYGQHLLSLVLGSQSPVLEAKRACATQAPGGTGALRLAADFIHKTLPQAKVWVSRPTWPNHLSIFEAAGVPTRDYAYVDAATNSLDFESMLADLQEVAAGDVVLLHACCHNPSGFDLSEHQWQKIADLAEDKGFLPLIDFAYQGFGLGLEEDAYGVRLLAERLPEVIITSSCSKNFGLYRERLGTLIMVAANHDQMQNVKSQVAVVARANYSNPPAHGGAIVTTILESTELTAYWLQELDEMRTRILDLRHAFVNALKPQGLGDKFACIAEQKGMFSYTGLTPEQVDRLRDEYSIYMVRSGRINIAGINDQTLPYLCQAIAKVCQ
ncbi:aromatic-amino-acid transaminase [Allopseudospirillum japonicum]|uniref:Aminotransferase n=1 Tax=Allopseudospirillum japonicum TaxID=64971 RepID=A0A1H6SIN6_9GAMM|nr:amino acid aminotransferase [Allopseudospirillum japonicum]SEI66766.1 aromatic-amino-acid transaminase [Allopseudospirillum japonicum]